MLHEDWLDRTGNTPHSAGQRYKEPGPQLEQVCNGVTCYGDTEDMTLRHTRVHGRACTILKLLVGLSRVH